jgi:transglutaminase-like putative cysteine protease
MSDDKSGEGWGGGDTIYACDVRKGNCTDFHSLFIGMARASNIPARFVSGFPVPENANQGEIPAYHCWAKFYINGLAGGRSMLRKRVKIARNGTIFLAGWRRIACSSPSAAIFALPRWGRRQSRSIIFLSASPH